MVNKICSECRAHHPKEISVRGRCPTCAKKKEQARGSRRERGIGPEHERFARMLKQYEAPCAHCGQPHGDPDNPITVGHKIPRARFANPLDADHWNNFQAECRKCNYGKSNDAK